MRRSRQTAVTAKPVDLEWLRDVPAELREVALSLPLMVDTHLAATICSCTDRTIRDRVRRGELQGVRHGAGSAPVLIPRMELVRWLAARLTPAVTSHA
jgi:hypothetical protein